MSVTELSSRVKAFIRQECERASNGWSPHLVEKIIGGILNIAGERSHGRGSVIRLVRWLIGDGQIVVAPCCPDYTHEEGLYNFRGLGSGVSLLAQRHIVFLTEVQRIWPAIRPLLLIANHESDDPELCRSVGVSQEEFRARIDDSVQVTRENLPSGWQVEHMTHMFPSLVDTEAKLIRWLSAEGRYRRRIEIDTIQRSGMYQRIRHDFTVEEMKGRTTRTAAQYVAFGRFAAQNGWLVCNHTTTNLAWYFDETEVAVLQNPVTVY